MVVPFYQQLWFLVFISVLELSFANLARGNDLELLTQDLSFWVGYKPDSSGKYNMEKNLLLLSRDDDTHRFISDILSRPTTEGNLQTVILPESPVRIEWQLAGWWGATLFYSVQVSLYAYLFQAPAAVLKMVVSTIASQLQRGGGDPDDPLNPHFRKSTALSVAHHRDEDIIKVMDTHVSVNGNDVKFAEAKIRQEMKALVSGYNHITNNTYVAYMMRLAPSGSVAAGRASGGNDGPDKNQWSKVPADCQRNQVREAEVIRQTKVLKKRRRSSGAQTNIEAALLKVVVASKGELDCKVLGSGKLGSSVVGLQNNIELTRLDILTRMTDFFQRRHSEPKAGQATAASFTQYRSDDEETIAAVQERQLEEYDRIAENWIEHDDGQRRMIANLCNALTRAGYSQEDINKVCNAESSAEEGDTIKFKLDL